MMVKADNMEIMSILSDATNKISEGEVQQLLNIGNLDISAEAYHEIIANKTAKLFEAACQLAAVISGQDSTMKAQLGEFGMRLGTAFQIADDVLDYMADDNELGKNLGDDFREGKLTLPLIHLLKSGNAQQQNMIRTAIETPDQAHFGEVRQMVLDSDAIDYTLKVAQQHSQLAQQAISTIPESTSKAALLLLCEYAWKRTQ
jgi:octaprenyl-diphosphate synthase